MVAVVVIGALVTGAQRPGEEDGGIEAILSRPLPENQLKEFTFILRDPNRGYRPAVLVNLSLLQSENGDLGPFKTAAYKSMDLQNLRIQVYRYSPTIISDKGRSAEDPLDFTLLPDQVARTAKLDSPEDLDVFFYTLLERLRDLKRFREIDLTNTRKIEISGFTCDFYQDSQSVLRVSSRKAFLSCGEPVLLLRGRAAIQAGEKTLESNLIRWDLVNRHFSTDRRYLLTRNDTQTFGKGIRLDAALHPPQSNFTERIGEKKSWRGQF